MDTAKTLIRTVVRTFFGIRHILIIDALLIHSVLHADDLAVLLSTQPKDIRALVTPLRAARLLSTHGRTEARVGSTRGVQREYYYIPLHPAIDAIKYKITRLRKKVEQLYQIDVKRKDWKCPHCKAEWDDLEVLDKAGPEGFECHRCGHVLEHIDRADDSTGGFSHEKIRRLNIQLKPFDEIIAKIDRLQVPENRFEEAWERKKDVPREKASGQSSREFVAVGASNRDRRAGNGPGETDARRLDILITSGEDGLKVEEEEKERRRKELAKQNMLPIWHTASVISTSGVKAESDGNALTNGMLKKEEGIDEKKPDVQNAMQSEMEAYLAELEREKEEERRKAEEEDAEDMDGEDFEDVVDMSNVGTPISSQVKTESFGNGIKREFEYESGPSSDANTPAELPERDPKRPKLENGDAQLEGVEAKAEDSEEEGDFEDAI